MDLIKCNESGEEASIGLKIICFLIPLIGIIIFSINITTRPKLAKQCLLASLLPVIIVIGGFIVLSILSTAMYILMNNIR